MALSASDDPFEEETRSALQARLALMFAVLCGVSRLRAIASRSARPAWAPSSVPAVPCASTFETAARPRVDLVLLT